MVRWFLAMLFCTMLMHAQSLVNVYNFPYYDPYNYFWGISHQNDNLWLGTDYDNSATYPFSKVYKVSKTGQLLDSLVTPFKFNHGLAWDGSNFWLAEDYRSSGARIYKMNTSGVKLDSITLPSLIGGATGGVGDIEIVGNNLWFSVYYPDFSTYPNSYAYCMNLTNRMITDTIPLRGRQVYGLTVKGDTLFYVSDNFQGDPERIYAYRKAVGDTIFSFSLPDADGDNNPKGLHWDGQYLWLLADRVGSTAYAYKALYKYMLGGSGTPVLQTAGSLAFGDVTIGLSKSQSLTIYNQGTGNLRIDSIRSNSTFFTYSPIDFPHSIAPGQSKTYQVTFSPQNAVQQNGTLVIYNNDVTTPAKTITLTGRGVYGLPYITTTRDSLQFGVRRKNSITSQEFTLVNQGGGSLRIDSISFTSQYFSVGTQSFPITIDSTQSKAVRVWFLPQAITPYTDTLVLFSNAGNRPVLKMSIAGQGIALDSVLGSILWQGTIPDNPATGLQDLSARQIKKTGDLNNDGYADLIVSTDNYFVIAYSGNSSVASEIIWAFNTAESNVNSGNVERMQCMQVGTDITGDGINDVIIGTAGGGESVIAINGKTGSKVWEFGDSLNYDTGDIMGIDCKRDWNSDGIPDILATASGNENSGNGRYSVFCLNGVNGSVIWQINESAEHKMKYGVVSTDDGGAYGSRVAGLTPGEVRGFNKSGQVQWTFATPSAPWAIEEIPNIGGNPGSDIVVGDISGNIYCLDGKSGTQLWYRSIGNAFAEDIFITQDINNSGKKDILVSALVSPLYLLEGANGNILAAPNTGGTVLGAAELGDINGDGKNDIAAANLANYVRIFNSVNGNEIFNYQYATGSNGTAVESIWRMGDIDGNGKDEFVFGTRDGKLIAMYGGPVNNTFPYVNITAPNGGEVLQSGSILTISWTSNAIQNVTISFSSDGGTNWTIIIPSLPASPGTYTWTIPAVSTTNALIKVADAASANIFDVSDGTFTINTSANTATFMLQQGWNLVGIPLVLQNMLASSVFQNANSPVFGFASGYSIIDTLKTKKGYWVRYPGSSTFTVNGNNQVISTLEVNAGWNLIAFGNQPVPINSITTTPPGIINSQFFAYNGGYVIPQNYLESTKGYWIRTSQPGSLNISTNTSADMQKQAAQAAEAELTIQFSDAAGNRQSLYIGAANSDIFSAMPPLPPAGVFDSRFVTDTYFEPSGLTNYKVRLQGITCPLQIQASGKAILVTDALSNGKIFTRQILPGEKAALNDQNITEIFIAELVLPEKFELIQNFPNPFNPETEIRFTTPNRSKVSIEVYNIVGELVDILVNKEFEAGFHKIQWNATHLNSGVYIYKMRAGKFQVSKKMMYLK